MNEHLSQPRPAAEPARAVDWPNGHAAPASEAAAPRPAPAFARCPFLGMTWDRATSFLHPSPSHVCAAQQGVRVTLARQAAVCMTASFARCAAHLAALAPTAAALDIPRSKPRTALRRLAMLVQSVKGQEERPKGGLAAADLFQETP